jgi:hypothetical protein
MYAVDEYQGHPRGATAKDLASGMEKNDAHTVTRNP